MSLSLAPGASPVAGYTLHRLLGRGGFGEVWEAVAPGGVRVALKFVQVNPDQAGPEERALKVVSNIRHPHLLDVQFAARVGDYLVIAMPLCDKSLWDRLRECREQGASGVPYDELIGYMDETARAVDYLNEPRHDSGAGDGRLVGVQHRDIKPHNIFLVGGSARLADFGVAKMLEGRTGEHTGNMSPHYVAPEVLDGRMCQQTDQYSLAMTYCHLRTGRLPFRGDSISQLIYAHLHQQADLSGLPEPERRVVFRALAKNPDERWPNCRAFVRALAAAGPGASASSEPTSRDEAGSPLPATIMPHQPDASRAWSRPQTASVQASSGLPTQSLYQQAGTTQRIDSTTPGVAAPPVRRGGRRLVLGGVAAALAGAGLLWALPKVRPEGGNGPPLPFSVPAGRDVGASAPTREREEAPQLPVAPRPPERLVAVADSADSKPKPEPEPEREPEREPKSQPQPEAGHEPTPSPARTETPADAASTASPAHRRGDERSGPPASQSAGASSELAAQAALRPPEAERDLAVNAHQLLKKYCYRCHGVRFEVPGFNVLDRDVLVASRGEEEAPYVVAGRPDESALWDRVGVEKDMPPSNPKPTDADRELLGRWIKAGAEFPPTPDRPFRGETELLAAVRDRLRSLPEADRVYQRFFTLQNLYNNKSVGDDDLRLARAATAKLVNSLSWKTDVVALKPIDRDQLVLALDLRDVGWDERDRWNELLSRYPYGLKQDQARDPARRELAREVYQLADSSMPYVRADWFVANASRPPLYHAVLEIPEALHELEKTLKVDPHADFLRNKLARAGFATSGVSSQNRLVDRHSAAYGAYWKSYDFKKNEGTANLFRFPLGPVFDGNPYPRQAFVHAGGEIIFNLPNGLQGYMLVDAADHRIDAGPIEVVGDALKTAGTSAIVPGLSCMACHQPGIIPFKDTIRTGAAVEGEAREKVEALYPEQAVMDQWIAKDQRRYLAALDAAAGAFLKHGEDKEASIRDFPEPVGAVARAYLKDLGPDDVAAELGVSDPKELPALLQASQTLRRLGLAPLAAGAAIKRTDWDSLENRATSTFQEAAHELGLGIPFRSY